MGEAVSDAAAVARGVARRPRAARRRRDADRAVTALLAALPHEVRRSLGVISLLADGERRTAILEETRRLDRLIDAVAEIGRMADLGCRVAVEPLRVEDVVTAAVEAFALDPDACPVTVRSGGGLPSVAGNAALVERVLLNLLANASRHGAPPVVLETSGAGGWVDLTVTDCGPGIPSAEPGRAEPAPAPPSGSMGVGLAISRLFAEGMGGSIVVGPQGGGGRVTLRLPEAAA